MQENVIWSRLRFNIFYIIKTMYCTFYSRVMLSARRLVEYHLQNVRGLKIPELWSLHPIFHLVTAEVRITIKHNQTLFCESTVKTSITPHYMKVTLGLLVGGNNLDYYNCFCVNNSTSECNCFLLSLANMLFSKWQYHYVMWNAKSWNLGSFYQV